jgi:Luciferase-like monooxygenase
MRFCAYAPTFGRFAEAGALGAVAVEAERAGWDGVMIYDVMEPIGPAEAAGDPVVDPWVALAVMASRTQRIQMGPIVTPLPRRRPVTLARQAVAIDRLSNGRLILGVGTGVAEELEVLGEETDVKRRAEMVDEGLEVLQGLWTGAPFSYSGRHYVVRDALFNPKPLGRIPIWVGVAGPAQGAPPFRRPLQRAARWNGIAPVATDPDIFHDGHLSVEQVEAMMGYIRELRPPDATFDFALLAGLNGNSPRATRDAIAAYEQAGVTWWLENVPPDLDDALEFVRQGPPPR